MQADKRVPHFPFNLLTGNERRDRVHNNNIQRTGANQGIRNLKPLLAAVRLRNQQGIDIYPQRPGINRIKRVLGVYKCRFAAYFLRLRNTVESNRRFTRRFRPVNFNNTSFRQSANSQRNIKAKRSGRNMVNVHRYIFAETHNRPFAMRLFEIAQYLCKRLLLVLRRFDARQRLFLLCHVVYIPPECFSYTTGRLFSSGYKKSFYFAAARHAVSGLPAVPGHSQHAECLTNLHVRIHLTIRPVRTVPQPVRPAASRIQNITSRPAQAPLTSSA